MPRTLKDEKCPCALLRTNGWCLGKQGGRGRERQKIERKILRPHYSRHLPLFSAIPSSSEPVAALQPKLTVKTQRLAKGLKKMKVKPSICPEAGLDSQIQ